MYGQREQATEAGEALEAAQGLLTLLQQETDALARQDADAIERLAAEKLAAVERLQAAGIEDFLTRHSADTGVVAELRELLGGISAANERNGIHIAQRMRTVEREIAILHGAVGEAESSGLYTRTGDQQGGARSRQITSA